MSLEYQYPPDLFQLLVDAIPLLCKSKQNVLTFFRGAGVDPHLLEDLQKQVHENRGTVKKYEMVSTVLTRLNEQGERGLAQRRSVLKRVVEWENFSACYPDNQQAAQLLVKQIADLVGAKDAVTRAQEIERSQQKLNYLLRQNTLQQQKSELREIRGALTELFRCSNAQMRGIMLESVLNRYFKVSGMLVREAFTLTGPDNSGIVEQIDGAVEIDGTFYLVEMKWWQQPIGVAEVAHHVSRLFSRSHANGIFVSASGYTPAAIYACREALQHKVVILCELREIVQLLENEQLLRDFLKSKIFAAVIDKNPLYYPLSVDINI